MLTHSPTFLRQRRLWTVLPLLTLPFLTAIFWRLGGGKAVPRTDSSAFTTGLNPELPVAQLAADAAIDKLRLYQQAQRDSVKRGQAQRQDPYARPAGPERSASTNALLDLVNAPAAVPVHPDSTADPVSANQSLVETKLAQVEALLAEPTAPRSPTAPQESPVPSPAVDAEVARLETVMQRLTTPDEPDPEMVQLDSTLDKILDIQHPQRMRQRLEQQAIRPAKHALRVESTREAIPIALLESPENNGDQRAVWDSLALSIRTPVADEAANGFYGLPETEPSPKTGNALEAEIAEEQTLLPGSVIALRLLEEATLPGTLLPAGTRLYGRCARTGDRLTITLSSVRLGTSLYPVALEAYDLDGLPGLHLPASVSKNLPREALTQAVPNLDLPSLEPSLGAEAASAGLQVARSLLRLRSRTPKINLPAGYRLLLRNTH